MHRDHTRAHLLDRPSLLEDPEHPVSVATTFVRSGHAIDLSDCDLPVGLLCARTRDLPPQDGLVPSGGLRRRRETLMRATAPPDP